MSLDDSPTVLDSYTAARRYDEYLDEVYGPVTVAGETFDTSRALRLLSPTTYHVGLNDWADSQGIVIE